MTSVEIVDGRLKMEVLGWHKLRVNKMFLDFPLEHVVAAERWDRAKHSVFWCGPLKTGIYFPGWIVAGTFYGWRRTYFYDVSDFSRAIVIELREESYARVVVEVEEPEVMLWLITERIAAEPELAAGVAGQS